ncbi:hypothetical protein NQ317_018903 [Molorchus minor]|uniref:Ornithine decarboxylase n=1 Tax=Molorchus minor TaxID=1323400 RepID=A0ABQ9JKS1_9CUCU|nr:hypothetical protein NQ317_018903 [Molorchus minor]
MNGINGTNGYKNSDNLIQVLDGEVQVDSVLKEITKDSYQEDPFYICDVRELIRRHEDWKNVMPRVGTHYGNVIYLFPYTSIISHFTVKCNDSRIVLETLAALGTGFDCASEGEIRKVVSHLKYAAEVGVDVMTFDNEYELYKVKRVFPNAKLVIRIKYDDLSARYVLGHKFGCDPHTEAAPLIRVAASLGLRVIGVCFHVGSDSKDISIFENAIAASRRLFDEAASLGVKLELLDIGGGFPGEKNKPIKKGNIGEIINSALERYFPDRSIKITSEPGRYYVNTAFTLASRIHSMRDLLQTGTLRIVLVEFYNAFSVTYVIWLENDGSEDPVTQRKETHRMYYVDVSVYGALIPVFYVFGESYTIRPLHRNPKAELRPCTIWGPTCDTFDKISRGVDMLPEMQIGDWVVFEETGAYTLSIACEFNGFATPKVHSVIDEEGWGISPWE